MKGSMCKWDRMRVEDDETCNVVSVYGGKWRIADREYGRFLEHVFSMCESHQLFLTEIAIPRRHRLFFDIDIEDGEDKKYKEDDLRAIVEKLVNDYFVDNHRGVFKWRDGSNGCHIIFPTVVVDRAMRRTVTTMLKNQVPEVDLSVSGLRLPGCYGKSRKGGLKAPYFPLTAQASIHCGADHCLTERVPRLNHKQVLLYPTCTSYLKNVHSQRNKDEEEVQDVTDHIRSLEEEWKLLSVDKALKWSVGGQTFTVRGPGQTYCTIAKRRHNRNRIFFYLSPDGRFFQKCFKCKRECAERDRVPRRK